jgi:hypothetical protein
MILKRPMVNSMGLFILLGLLGLDNSVVYDIVWA